MHANSATDVPARLEALALAAGLPRAALHAQLAAGLDAVVHVGRHEQGVRMVREVCVLRPGPDQLVAAIPALVFDPNGVRAGPGLPTLTGRLGLAAA